jgi:uncharacterized protein (TIGR02118 family)
MIKVVMLLHRRPGMTVGDFRRYWHENHTPLVLQLPGLTRLVYNYVQPNGSDTPAACDGVAEDWFESAEAMTSAFNSPQGNAVVADASMFLDMSNFRMLVVEEDEILP